MTNELSMKPPRWFWILSVVALIWNLMGVLAYLAEAFMPDEMRAGMSTEQLGIMEDSPTWTTAAFAIAVWAGLLGCIGLLLRKKWATMVLTVSIFAVLARTVYYFFMTDATAVFDVFQGTVMPILTVAIGIALVLFSRNSENQSWIA